MSYFISPKSPKMWNLKRANICFLFGDSLNSSFNLSSAQSTLNGETTKSIHVCEG